MSRVYTEKPQVVSGARRDALHHRYAYIDVFRFVAIAFVVSVHSVVIRYTPPKIETFFDSSSFEWLAFNLGAPLFRGHMGVEIFFCISGVTMSLVARKDISQNNWNIDNPEHFKIFRREFWIKRLLRIYPIFIVSIVAYNLFIYSSFLQSLATVLAVVNVPPSIFTRLTPITWSLMVELQFYLIFPFIFKWVSGARIRMGYLLIATLPGLALLQFFFPSNSTGVWYMLGNNLPAFLFFFIFGMFIHEYRPEISQIWVSRFVQIVSISLLGVLLFWSTDRDLTSSETLTFMVLTSLAIATSMMVLRRTIDDVYASNSTLIWPMVLLGKASYSIYLFHLFGILLVNSFMGDMPAEILIPARILGGVLVGSAAYVMLEVPLLMLKDSFLGNLRR